jgi:hypothetical protein
MSENRVEGLATLEGSAGLAEVHTGKHRRLDRQLSFREPGKWCETLTSENRGEDPGSRVESPVWDAGYRGGNGDAGGEDWPSEELEAVASEADAFRRKANKLRALRRRRDVARKGAASGRTWVPVLSPVPAIRFINDDGEVFERPALDSPLRPGLPDLSNRRT